jgi:predicted transcriptional regulator of viral defense system
MTTRSEQSTEAWPLAERQHWVLTRGQLLALGFTPSAIRHRIAEGRLHPVARGVYAVGRPELSAHGRWMAAVLSCGPHAALSHVSAAALWASAPDDPSRVHVSIPSSLTRRRPGLVIHRRDALSSPHHQGVAVH